MTVWEAMNKYRDYYFQMVITEKVDRGNQDKGYVIYIYDDKRELRNIPDEPHDDLFLGYEIGVAAEKGIYIGGVEIHGKI